MTARCWIAPCVSGEGKLQVELARLQYQLPRLAGRGVQLSRQGGGGTGGTGARRGAGESKLEVDRRHIRRRIDALKTELAALARRREQRRTRRKKDGVTTVAIVGYTNVGKSTLLNTLTQAGVLAEDKLFATLDPTSRALELPDGRKVMLIDTVGLVRRLPHQLVEAFHSTLEEAANADLILNVCDITSPELLEQRAVTERLLEGLAERQVRVTFFVCGYRIAEFPDTLSHIAAAGHEIGLHSSNHDYMQKMDYGTALRDLTGCAKAVEDACGVRARLFRPPGGLYGDTLLKAAGDAGLSVILWSVDPCDWNEAAWDGVLPTVLSEAHDGRIILMHDLSAHSVTCALQAVDRLQAQGYTFCTVSELAALRGTALLPGEVYTGFPPLDG